MSSSSGTDPVAVVATSPDQAMIGNDHVSLPSPADKLTTTTTTTTTPSLVRVPLSPAENLAVGAFGGALETCLQMPILTYKFCLQEGRALPTTMGGFYRGVGVQAGTTVQGVSHVLEYLQMECLQAMRQLLLESVALLFFFLFGIYILGSRCETPISFS